MKKPLTRYRAPNDPANAARIKLVLRLNKKLHAMVTRAAQAEARSLNSEIVQRLEQSFNGY